jgi:hypothetical protein
LRKNELKEIPKNEFLSHKNLDLNENNIALDSVELKTLILVSK